jgi:serine/threonine-protein kinase
VKVPKVIGLTEEAARAALKRARLSVGTVTKAYNETVKEGLVIAVTPPADTVKKPGDTVALVISRGREPVTVPKLVGLTRAKAESRLEALGLRAKVVMEFSDTVDEGDVMAQDIADGTSTFKGQTVTITVSKGVETFPVPDVIGKERGDARKIIEDAGFVVRFVDFPGRPGRRVIDQDPNGGDRARKGATVTLYMF